MFYYCTSRVVFTLRATLIVIGCVYINRSLILPPCDNPKFMHGSNMQKTSTSQNTGKRTSSTALSPRISNKNRFAPLSNLNDDSNDANTEKIDMDIEEVKQKIPPLYIYDINDYNVFLKKISPLIVENFNINNRNIFLKLNLSTVDDYRTITKYLSVNQIKYHTYKLPEDRNLSVIIRNLPISITEAEIYEALS